MTFASPWMLLGALAALIPLLVHLFDRRRPRPHPFGAISFVLKSQRRTASRLKLKRLILYLLRTAVLLALPIALARPELRKEGSAALAAHGPAATAIVLDGSLSMRWSDGTSLFERAKNEAREALKELTAEEPASFMLCHDGASPPGAPHFNRSGLRSQIDDARVTYGGADLIRCLELAAKDLEESPVPGKRLVLISDLTQGSLRLERPPPTLNGPKGEKVRPEVVLRDVGDGKALVNHAIVDLKVEPATQVGPRAFQFTITVRNHSGEAVKDLQASLVINGQLVAKGFIDLPPFGTAQKSLAHRFDQGGTATGEVVLQADGLTEDDRRAFAVAVPKELKALVVNGAPHSVRYRDEAFFVEAALNAPGSPVRQALRDVDSGYKEDFAQYDLVMLLNTPVPPADVAARLQAFVERGGGLFLSMGDNVEPDAYNLALGGVLPRRLRLTKTAVNPDEPDVAAKSQKLSQVSQEHPVFSLFTGRAREGLFSSRFYRYMLLEADAPAEKQRSQVLATFEDGAPALAVARRGKGRVLLFTSTVDRDWADFAIRTSFLPLMQRFSAYLCGALEEREELKARVGQVLTFPLDTTTVARKVRTPSGEELKVAVAEGGQGSVGPLHEPGPYTVLGADDQPAPPHGISVVLDPAESDLSRHKPEALTHYFGEETLKTASGGTDQRTPFWTWLIVLAAVAFFFEGVLLKS